MALSDIIAKIQSEAEVKAAELKSEHEDKMKDLQADNVQLLKTMEEENIAATEEIGGKMKLKAEMEAEMEAKNALLTAKRELIDETLEQSVSALASAERYEDLLAEMMKKADFESGEVIPAKGKEDATKNAIQKAGRNFTLASDSANIKGGFILKADKVEVDNSFETVINQQLRQNLEIELNKTLFA